MTIQIVIDTNVIVSALRSKAGASYKLLSLVGRKDFEINLSIPLFVEYEDALMRPECMTLLGSSEIEDVLSFLCHIANKHRIFFLWRPYLKDHKDDFVLELAVKASCQYIVSYNLQDFKGVQKFNVECITPKEFLKYIGEL